MQGQKEITQVQIPLYCLNLGEEEELDVPVPKLASGDSESHLETTDRILQEKKVKLGWLVVQGMVRKENRLGLFPRKMQKVHDPVLIPYFSIRF